MSEKKFCPECNAPLEGNEMFCDNCGASLKASTDNSINETNAGAIATNRETEGDGITRSNIMGSVNKTTTNNTSNSVTTNKVDNSTSTVTNSSSTVDNSTVNNTTIVMSGKSEAEFCEVCGNPFEGKHARCPKCGKSICFDCKVKGKNRCIECEKKAISEYRMAFQELLLTTNGEIGVAGRQMMNRKAQELDIEDSKKSIEEELLSMYKPQVKAQQPDIIPSVTVAAATVATTAANSQEASKGIGALNGGPGIRPEKAGKKESGSGSKMWIFIAGGIVALVLAYMLLGGGNNESKAPAKPDAAKTEKPVAAPAQQTAAPAQQQTATPAPTVTETAKPEPVVEKSDPKFDAGMKAYDSGDGLKALEHFKASGSAKAYYMIGLIYENGCGKVGKNAMMARKNYKTAAKMGNSEAKAKL